MVYDNIFVQIERGEDEKCGGSRDWVRGLFGSRGLQMKVWKLGIVRRSQCQK